MQRPLPVPVQKSGTFSLPIVLEQWKYVAHWLCPGFHPGPTFTPATGRSELNATTKQHIDKYYAICYYCTNCTIYYEYNKTMRYGWRGTHQGELMGIPATGKQVIASGISILRVANGKIAEQWDNFDNLGMLQQLGALPAMG